MAQSVPRPVTKGPMLLVAVIVLASVAVGWFARGTAEPLPRQPFLPTPAGPPPPVVVEAWVVAPTAPPTSTAVPRPTATATPDPLKGLPLCDDPATTEGAVCAPIRVGTPAVAPTPTPLPYCQPDDYKTDSSFAKPCRKPPPGGEPTAAPAPAAPGPSGGGVH